MLDGCRQIAEARRSRLELLDPHTPTDEWKLLSKRKNLMIDAEDARTELFRMETEMSVEAHDIERVEEEIGHDAVDERRSATTITSQDVMARLV